MLIPILLLALAIIFLYFGAEFSLTASEKIGRVLGLSPFVIGMLIIGFGTSLPELFVGHIAANEGQFGIALGSLVGSNIANMCLILGICALFIKLPLSGSSIFKHLVIHLLLCLVLGYVLSKESLNIFTAIPLLSIVFIYLVTIVGDIRKGFESEADEDEISTPKAAIFLVLGFVMLYGGGELLVYSGTKLAFSFGVSEYIVSSILVAFGTSFPELVTALLAVYKKKDTQLIVGNIIGSNIFNCAFILGSLGIYNITLGDSYLYEVGTLVGASVILCSLSVMSKSLGKISGVIFLGLYFYMVSYWTNIFPLN